MDELNDERILPPAGCFGRDAGGISLCTQTGGDETSNLAHLRGPRDMEYRMPDLLTERV
jgi:hypothetical protein